MRHAVPKRFALHVSPQERGERPHGLKNNGGGSNDTVGNTAEAVQTPGTPSMYTEAKQQTNRQSTCLHPKRTDQHCTLYSQARFRSSQDPGLHNGCGGKPDRRTSPGCQGGTGKIA